MQQDIETYKYWQEVGFHLADNEPVQAVILSPTYQEWLRENPDGYIFSKE